MEINIDLMDRYFRPGFEMPKQYDFISSDKFISCLFGGFGNGKTEALCWRGISLSLLFPKALGLIGRATYPELRDSTIRSFFAVCPPELIRKYHKQENMVTLVNGGEIVFRAYDDPIKILSMNLGWALIDQLEEITEELFLQTLGRLRHPDCRYFGGVGNPEPGWAKRRFKDNAGKDVDLLFVEATSYDNPYLPKDYLENLKKNYPDFWIKRYVYGDWTSFEGQVFSEFKEAVNVIDPFEVPKEWKRTYIMDYGYRNPFAALCIVSDYDDNHYLVQEHYEREQIISWHVELLKANMGITKKSYILVDPSCRAKIREKNGMMISIIDEFNEHDIFPIPADNNVAGTLRVNQWFKEGKLKIFRSCFNTIKEVGELSWKKVKPTWNDNLPEEEEDKNNHTTDCLKYFANSRTEGFTKPKSAGEMFVEMRKKALFSNKPDQDWYNS